LGKLPSKNPHFRVNDDDTILYRRTRATQTYRVTSEQAEKIVRLHSKETWTALLTAPPILPFGILTYQGNFGTVWKVTAVYTLLYCVFNFLLNKKTSSEIDQICQDAVLAPHEQNIDLPSLFDNLKQTTTKQSFRMIFVFFGFFAFLTVFSALQLMSIFVPITFIKIPDVHWLAKFFSGVAGMLFGGCFSYFALKDMQDRLKTRRQ
jgi:hypothetical protein